MRALIPEDEQRIVPYGELADIGQDLLDAQEAAGQSSCRDAARGLPDRQLEEYALNTPLDQKSPLFDELPADRFLHLPGAEEAWGEDAATHTEATDELDQRCERLAARLSQVDGGDATGLEFIIRVEQLIPEYRAHYGDWMAEDPEDRGKVPLKVYAMDKLGEVSADLFEYEADLKRHVYALGKLAGRTVRQNRMLCRNLWASSAHPTPMPPTMNGQGIGGEPKRPVERQAEGRCQTPPTKRYAAENIYSPPGIAVPPTPGQVTSHQEMVNMMETVTKGFSTAMDNVCLLYTSDAADE